LKRGAIIETPHSNSEFVLAYLAVRLMPNALLEPSQLQLPPQPEDFLEPRYEKEAPLYQQGFDYLITHLENEPNPFIKENK